MIFMRYLGVDWGMKKIGLAISEGSLSSPHGEISINSLQDGIEKLSKVIETEEIDQIVIGLPENKMGKIVLNVTKILQNQGLNVVTTDETLSSQKAMTSMIKMGTSKKARRHAHAESAAIILQEYLDDQI